MRRDQHIAKFCIRLFMGGLLVFSLLSGCSSTRLDWDPNDYTVKSGDTLYSIAWRYELDPMELARWNNLSSPYIIRPGDRLHTRESSRRDTQEQEVTSSYSGKPEPVAEGAVITVKKGDTLYSLARQNDMPVSKLASINGLKKPYVIHPGQQLSLQSNAAVTRSPISTSGSMTAGSSAKDITISWQWPIKGKLIGKFNRHQVDAKGIDIAGSEGRPVKAAANGKVVYSGNGLISYGNLVIIKHSASYLSAYAHNRKLLVKEGETVSAGQNIAELGSTGAESPRLHFEIRRNGKPVDPLKYLPSS